MKNLKRLCNGIVKFDSTPNQPLHSAQLAVRLFKSRRNLRTVTNLAKPRSSSIMVRPTRQRLVSWCWPLKVVDLCRSSNRLCQNASTASFKAEQNPRKGRNQACINTPSSSMVRPARRRLLYSPMKRYQKCLCVQTKSIAPENKRNLDLGSSAKLSRTGSDAPLQKQSKQRKLELPTSSLAVQRQPRSLPSGGSVKRSRTQPVSEFMTSTSKRKKFTNH